MRPGFAAGFRGLNDRTRLSLPAINHSLHYSFNKASFIHSYLPSQPLSSRPTAIILSTPNDLGLGYVLICNHAQHGNLCRCIMLADSYSTYYYRSTTVLISPGRVPDSMHAELDGKGPPTIAMVANKFQAPVASAIRTQSPPKYPLNFLNPGPSCPSYLLVLLPPVLSCYYHQHCRATLLQQSRPLPL